MSSSMIKFPFLAQNTLSSSSSSLTSITIPSGKIFHHGEVLGPSIINTLGQIISSVGGAFNKRMGDPPLVKVSDYFILVKEFNCVYHVHRICGRANGPD